METVTRLLESQLESVDFAEDMVVQAARRTGFTEGSVARIGLAVREIFTNAVVHGNRYDLTKSVRLELRSTAQQFEITISDQGMGFDASLVPDPTDADGLPRPSGRGLFLARMFMDEFYVVHERVCGVKIIMVKYLRRI